MPDYYDDELLSETEHKFVEHVVLPLMAFGFYTRRDEDELFPSDVMPIRISPESISEGRYGMFTELTFKVMIPRGTDEWIEAIVAILNMFGTTVHHHEVCSPKYTSKERIEAQYTFKVHF